MANQNIEIKHLNGSGTYDTLYPKTIDENIEINQTVANKVLSEDNKLYTALNSIGDQLTAVRNGLAVVKVKVYQNNQVAPNVSIKGLFDENGEAKIFKTDSKGEITAFTIGAQETTISTLATKYVDYDNSNLSKTVTYTAGSYHNIELNFGTKVKLRTYTSSQGPIAISQFNNQVTITLVGGGGGGSAKGSTSGWGAGGGGGYCICQTLDYEPDVVSNIVVGAGGGGSTNGGGANGGEGGSSSYMGLTAQGGKGGNSSTGGAGNGAGGNRGGTGVDGSVYGYDSDGVTRVLFGGGGGGGQNGGNNSPLAGGKGYGGQGCSWSNDETVRSHGVSGTATYGGGGGGGGGGVYGYIANAGNGGSGRVSFIFS